MHDGGPQYDNPGWQRASVPPLIELGPIIPGGVPLTAAEILKVSASRLGLRNTSVDKLPVELSQGVSGDFLLISNLDNFLRLKLDNAAKTGSHKDKQNQLFFDGAVRAGNLKMLEGLDFLPEKYDQALCGFIDNAIGFRTKRGFIDEKISVWEYLEKLKRLAPAFLLVQGRARETFSTTPDKDLDEDRYEGFGKNGGTFLKPEDLLASCVLTDGDFEVLSEKYHDYMPLELSQSVWSNKKSEKLINTVNRDVVNLIHQRVLDMIRGRLAAKDMV